MKEISFSKNIKRKSYFREVGNFADISPKIGVVYALLGSNVGDLLFQSSELKEIQMIASSNFRSVKIDFYPEKNKIPTFECSNFELIFIAKSLIHDQSYACITDHD